MGLISKTLFHSVLEAEKPVNYTFLPRVSHNPSGPALSNSTLSYSFYTLPLLPWHQAGRQKVAA